MTRLLSQKLCNSVMNVLMETEVLMPVSILANLIKTVLYFLQHIIQPCQSGDTALSYNIHYICYYVFPFSNNFYLPTLALYCYINCWKSSNFQWEKNLNHLIYRMTLTLTHWIIPKYNKSAWNKILCFMFHDIFSIRVIDIVTEEIDITSR